MPAPYNVTFEAEVLSLELKIFLISRFLTFNISFSLLRFSLCGIGGALLLTGLVVLSCIDQDDTRHSFGHSGGMFLMQLV